MGDTIFPPSQCCKDRTSVGVVGPRGPYRVFWVSGPEPYAADYGLFVERPFSRMNSRKSMMVTGASSVSPDHACQFARS